MTDSKSTDKPEPTVADHNRVARRADGSLYIVNVSGAKDLPEGTRTELENPGDTLLPASVTP